MGKRFFERKVVRRTEVVFGADPMALVQASVAKVVGVFSPMSRGADANSFYTGDHYTHKADCTFSPVAGVENAVRPIAYPQSVTVGMGYGVTGASDLPNASGDTMLGTLKWMGVNQGRGM